MNPFLSPQKRSLSITPALPAFPSLYEEDPVIYPKETSRLDLSPMNSVPKSGHPPDLEGVQELSYTEFVTAEKSLFEDEFRRENQDCDDRTEEIDGDEISGSKGLKNRGKRDLGKVEMINGEVTMSGEDSETLRFRKETKDSENYEEMVNSILDAIPTNPGVTELSERKDVINKRIIRGFKKFIVRLFDSKRIRPCRLTTERFKFKKEMIQEARRLEIISSDNTPNGEFSEFVCWMAMSKNTLKAKALFDYSNESIILMNEILAKYSHRKLQRLYCDTNIGQLYCYFFENGLYKFIKKCPDDKKDLYQKCAQELCNKFINYC
ncbi:unnamed protein product [Moneuplotes crassus]|uniref:Uncharacterized protein n=1 Tax=Euplotes crassus TaxID=5936 RepID=A0AAD1U376_EUPCR|nr:unnamed protein product [Moneuplotes crassus]